MIALPMIASWVILLQLVLIKKNNANVRAIPCGCPKRLANQGRRQDLPLRLEKTMSLIINCPYCGKRPVDEFTYGEVYDIPESITDPAERNLDRAYFSNNTKGVQREAWFHTLGCRRWYYFERDTIEDKFVE